MGILFRARRGGITFLHLAWHHDLRAEEPSKGYSWVDLPIPNELTHAIVGLCQVLKDGYVNGDDRISFAPRYAGGRFDPISGEFVPGGGYGLTCATFVLAVFASHGIRLLKTEEWPSRIDDLDWFRQILCQLSNPEHGASPEHVRAIESDVGCARFRPHEVAAAGTAGSAHALPLGFDEARRVGERLVEVLLARHSST